jgi:hypothetical protein
MSLRRRWHQARDFIQNRTEKQSNSSSFALCAPSAFFILPVRLHGPR